LPVWQSLVPEALKAQELELTPECIEHNLTAGADCFCAGSFQPLLQTLIKTNRERSIAP
jgi:hypothetical protein